MASNLHHDLEVGERSTTSTTRIVLVKLSVFEGESFSNRYKLSSRCDLGSCNRRKIFVFYATNPSHKPVLKHLFFFLGLLLLFFKLLKVLRNLII